MSSTVRMCVYIFFYVYTPFHLGGDTPAMTCLVSNHDTQSGMKMDNSYRLSLSKILSFQNYSQNEPVGVICLPRKSRFE